MLLTTVINQLFRSELTIINGFIRDLAQCVQDTTISSSHYLVDQGNYLRASQDRGTHQRVMTNDNI